MKPKQIDHSKWKAVDKYRRALIVNTILANENRPLTYEQIWMAVPKREDIGFGSKTTFNVYFKALKAEGVLTKQLYTPTRFVYQVAEKHADIKIRRKVDAMRFWSATTASRLEDFDRFLESKKAYINELGQRHGFKSRLVWRRTAQTVSLAYQSYIHLYFIMLRESVEGARSVHHYIARKYMQIISDHYLDFVVDSYSKVPELFTIPKDLHQLWGLTLTTDDDWIPMVVGKMWLDQYYRHFKTVTIEDQALEGFLAGLSNKSSSYPTIPIDDFLKHIEIVLAEVKRFMRLPGSPVSPQLKAESERRKPLPLKVQQ